MTTQLSFSMEPSAPNDAPIWTAPELLAFARASDADVRAWAWRRLQRLHPHDASREAHLGIADPSPTVAFVALDSLIGPPSIEARRALEALVERKDLSADTRAVAARRLAGKPEPKADDEDDDPTDRVDDEIERLIDAPDELFRHAPALLTSTADVDRVIGLAALESQGCRRATDLLLKHLRPLLTGHSWGLVWNSLDALGDPRALDAVVAEWRPGERRIASTARWLHGLSGRPEPLEDALVRDAEARTLATARLVDAMRASDFSILSDVDELRIDLRCTSCGCTCEYDVDRAAIHPRLADCVRDGWDGVVLGRIVVCKRCGAEDQYELTSSALGILGVLAVPGKTADNHDLNPNRRVIIAAMGLWDGTIACRPTASLAHLRALAEREPSRGEPWRRLGNLYERYDRLDAAVAAWTRAADDKTEMEACASLARHYFHEAHEDQKALDFAIKTIDRLRPTKSAEERRTRRMLVDMALEVLEEATPNLGAPIALIAGWGGPRGSKTEMEMTVSSIDLRDIRRWDRLGDLLSSDMLMSAGMTSELPQERPTILARYLEGIASTEGVAVHGPRTPERRATRNVGRNEPCPCGSDKKFKKCCGK